MASKKENVLICDVCKKHVSDGGVTFFGGHPHAGWFNLRKHGGPTDLKSLKAQKEWDVCGVKCLRALAGKFLEKV